MSGGRVLSGPGGGSVVALEVLAVAGEVQRSQLVGGLANHVALADEDLVGRGRAERVAFANDLSDPELIISSAHANESKGDGGMAVIARTTVPSRPAAISVAVIDGLPLSREALARLVRQNVTLALAGQDARARRVGAAARASSADRAGRSRASKPRR